jgi:5-methylcytosine-specific restriction protein A
MFEKGKVYKRTEIHDKFGGSRQSGIAASAQYPYIFIFSDRTGLQHGYIDRWENENIFSYSGEGQVGDMKMVRGNLALKDHLKNQKRVFLFFVPKKSFAVFNCELELIDIDYFDALDRNKNPRIGIKYFFKRYGTDVDYVNPNRVILLDPLDDFKVKSKPTVTEREGLVTSRVGQGAYRKSILYRWEFKCAVTKYNKPEILIASHIVPWKNASNDERLDVDNGILLSPNYDALFDQHLISFENGGKIILSEKLFQSNYSDLGVTGKEQIKDLTDANKRYLERHRELL